MDPGGKQREEIQGSHSFALLLSGDRKWVNVKARINALPGCHEPKTHLYLQSFTHTHTHKHTHTHTHYTHKHAHTVSTYKV